MIAASLNEASTGVEIISCMISISKLKEEVITRSEEPGR
jgi:hypothetical protein